MAIKRNDGDPAMARAVANEEWQKRTRKCAEAAATATLLKLVPRPQGSVVGQPYDFAITVNAPRLLNRRELDQLMGDLEDGAKRFCEDLLGEE